MEFIMLVLVLLGHSLAYDGCPGNLNFYVSTGLPEQWRCKDQCISVDKPCGNTCYSRFHLWGDQTCVRLSQWFECDNSTGVIGRWCGDNPDRAGCQPLQVPCGGTCPGGRGKYQIRYENWWRCFSEDQCVLSALVCSGYGPFCRDGSDQALNTCSSNFTTCLPVVAKPANLARIQQCKGGRTQCIMASNSGIDCIDRSDTDVKEQARHNNVNKSVSTELIDKLIKQLVSADANKCEIWPYPYPAVSDGIKCNNDCIDRRFWCKPNALVGNGVMCELEGNVMVDVRHLNDSICMDTQVWEGKNNCDNGPPKRWAVCPGHTAQCYDSRLECVGMAQANTCLDMSHKVCDKDKKYYFGKTRGADVCGTDGENKDMFLCKDGTRCISNKLLCDGIPQCADESDETDTKCSCPRPKELQSFEGPNWLFNRQVSSATVKCLDKRFPGLNISTCAVKCDGREECADGQDEKGCQEDATIFYITAVTTIVLFLAASILAVHFLAPCIQGKINSGQPTSGAEYVALQSMDNPDSTIKLIALICNTDQGPGEEVRQSERLELLRNLHEGPDFRSQIQLVAASLQIHPSKAEVERRNQMLKEMEIFIHQDEGDHEICIKNNMETNPVTEAVLKGTNVEMSDKLMNFVGSYIFCCCEVPEFFQERAFRLARCIKNHKYVRITLSLLEMAFYFLDLVKDIALIFIMFRLMISTNLEYTVFFFTFNGMLLLLMLYTVVFSMVLTAGYLSVSHPGVELQLVGVKKSGFLKIVRVTTFFLGLLVPTTLIYQLTRQKVTLHTLQESLMDTIRQNQGQVNPEDIHELQEQKNKVILLEFLSYVKQKNDLVLEVLIQTSVNVCMLLMVSANVVSLTETGLQAVFSESTFLLVAGFTMSIKKIVTSNMALISAEKNGFVPFTGKCIKTLAYLLTTLLRIGCVTLYFGLPLGGLNILIHKGSLESYNQETRDFIYDVQDVDGVQTIIRVRDIYTITNDNYTELTGMRLRWYGIIFSIGIFIHIGLVTVVKKCAFGEAFSQLPKMDKFLHVLHSVAFPEPSKDWDYGNSGSIHTYKRQWLKYKLEWLFMTVLHTIQNLLMAVPVVGICSNVRNYHKKLPYTTDLEKQTDATARTLGMIWPLIVVLVPNLQGLLLIAYNKYGHPWKSLYAKFDEISTDVPGDEEAGNLGETGGVIYETNVLLPQPSHDRQENHLESVIPLEDLYDVPRDTSLDKEEHELGFGRFDATPVVETTLQFGNKISQSRIVVGQILEDCIRVATASHIELGIDESRIVVREILEDCIQTATS